MMAVLELRKDVKKISVIGIGLGGLYARSALFIMNAQLKRSGYKLCAFCTLGTPHLGLRKYATAVRTFCYRYLMGLTGQELLLEDPSTYLCQLGGEAACEILSHFTIRCAYADDSYTSGVPYYSSSIESSTLNVVSNTPSPIINITIENPDDSSPEKAMRENLRKMSWRIVQCTLSDFLERNYNWKGATISKDVVELIVASNK
jgi:hypothetical protein